VSLENGIVLNFDARTLTTDLSTSSPPRFTLQAHDGAVSAIDVNPLIRGCIVTGGTDKLVKVWNVLDSDDGSGKRSVSLVTSRDLGVVSQPSIRLVLHSYPCCCSQGKVFSTVFSPDDPLTIAAAGSKAKLQIWDVGATFSTRKVFATKLAEAGRILKEKETSSGVIGVQSDNEDEDVQDFDDD
jgi:periodic tryptophan protein 1